MPISRSRHVASRIVLLVSAASLFALVAWVGYRVFQPIDIPPAMPAQSPVSFKADKAIEQNSIFVKLQMFVRGGYVVGTVGNSFPLGGDPKKKTPKGYDNKALLATAQELNFNGSSVKDIALSINGGIVALLQNISNDGQIHYVIRKIGLTEDQIVTQWDAMSRSDLRVAGLTIDTTGRIWLLNEKGQIGLIQTNGEPSWLPDISTGLLVTDPQKLSISSDTLDRVWITDGVNVSTGGEKSFSPIQLNDELTGDQRSEYIRLLTKAASQIGLQSISDESALLKAALAPKSFFPLYDGRMGLTTSFGAIIFPMSQSSRVEWIPTLEFAQIPYGISGVGDVWGVRYTDRLISRIKKGKDEPFGSGPSPKVEGLQPNSMSFLGGGGAFVFEQSDKMTNLWFSEGDEWGTKLVSTTGTQAVVAAPLKIRAEETGTLWSLMSDGHLYRITPGATVEAPPNEMGL